MSNDKLNSDNKYKKTKLREYVEAILTAVFIALLIRSFGIEAFKIPSSSMVPTLMVGDHIFVNKFIYGLRIPLTKIHFFDYKKPKRGDVIVFIYPSDESKDYIKRVVGLPGDVVKVEGNKLYINGEQVPCEPLKTKSSDDGEDIVVIDNPDFQGLPLFNGWKKYDFCEATVGDNHFITQYDPSSYRHGGIYEVPKDSYFVMGDNRDNSADSREWGFVPFENIKGKAMFIWLSLDKENGGIRFSRFGKWIH